jgi:hypothetical protein
MSSSIAILLLQTPPSQCLLTAANWFWEIRGLPYRGKPPLSITVCPTVSYARNNLPVRGTIALTVSHWFGNISYEE